MLFLKDKLLFFSVFLFWEFFLISFLLIYPKGEEFFLLDPFHNAYFDIFFKMITFLGDWPAYLIAFCYFFPKYKLKGILLVCALSILVPLSSHLTKSYFKHPRPGLYFKNKMEFQELHHIEGVKLHEGLSSFPSGHTLSAFAVFSLLAFFTRNKWLLTLSFLMIAIGVGISRIYLLQHFVEDVLFGAFLGVLLALIIYFFSALIILPGAQSFQGKG
ncbi:MAG: phosphatase PAP2 family protein [Bacteroidetes bacterium]|nr:phosphatase PAP2 family protein [Bacteroidota bacterium]